MSFKIPDAVTIYERFDDPLTRVLIVVYFIIGFAILYRFLRPKGPIQTAGVAGASVLWDIY